jgi:hypothetical protein
MESLSSKDFSRDECNAHKLPCSYLMSGRRSLIRYKSYLSYIPLATEGGPFEPHSKSNVRGTLIRFDIENVTTMMQKRTSRQPFDVPNESELTESARMIAGHFRDGACLWHLSVFSSANGFLLEQVTVTRACACAFHRARLVFTLSCINTRTA